MATFKVVWSADAKENIRDIFDYLLDNWSDAVAEKFTDNILALTLQLETFPYSGKPHRIMSAVRQLILKPHNIVYYTILDNTVYILNVIDGRHEL